MKTLLILIFAAIACGQTNLTAPAAILPLPDHTQPGPFLWFDQNKTNAVGLQAPGTGITTATITAATGANPMVLTVSGTLPAYVQTGTEIVIVGAVGAGCAPMNGVHPVTTVSGSTVTVGFNNTGCTYTASSATVPLIWTLPSADGTNALCGQSNGILSFTCTGLTVGNNTSYITTANGILNVVYNSGGANNRIQMSPGNGSGGGTITTEDNTNTTVNVLNQTGLTVYQNVSGGIGSSIGQNSLSVFNTTTGAFTDVSINGVTSDYGSGGTGIPRFGLTAGGSLGSGQLQTFDSTGNLINTLNVSGLLINDPGNPAIGATYQYAGVSVYNTTTGGFMDLTQTSLGGDYGSSGTGVPRFQLSVGGSLGTGQLQTMDSGGTLVNTINGGGITTTGTLTLSAMTGTSCLEEVSGVVTATGSACGTGGGGVTSITGTANEVLANGTSGSPQTGGVTLTLPSTVDITNLVIGSTLTLSMTGTQCLQEVSGVVTGTLAPCPNFSWASYTPSASGLTSTTSTGNYISVGNAVFVNFSVNGTSTGATPVVISLPVTASIGGQSLACNISVGTAYEAAALQFFGTSVKIYQYNNAAFANGTAYTFNCAGIYQ